VEVNDGQVWIGVQSLRSELRTSVFRVGVEEPAFPCAEPNEDELVIFTALKLECAPVCPVRNDCLPDFPQPERLPEPRWIGRRQISYHLSEKAIQVFHS
jgi:hypothetical protein